MNNFGLLGRKLSHSYSQIIHGKLGDYYYRLYEKEPEELDEFFRAGEFDGLNVTIPYKKAVLPYCTSLSPQAEALGSVNTIVKMADGRLFGDNTDPVGFEALVKKSGVSVYGKKALVFGSGGASATVCAVLKKLGSDITVISRKGADNYNNLENHSDAQIIVNTTPVGMFPNNMQSVADLRKFPDCEGVFDLIYNPAKTSLLQQAEEMKIPNCNGLIMLVAQAKRSSELFTGDSIDDAVVEKITKELSLSMQNIVLIGMPGCGKSTVGKALAKKLNRFFSDADSEIAAISGITIPEMLSRFGEEKFRHCETEVLSQLGKRSCSVIATGGGAVLREENYAYLHQNGIIIYLQRDIDELPTGGRPISQANSLSELYKVRHPLYNKFADCTVCNDSDIDAVVNRIAEVLDEISDY